MTLEPLFLIPSSGEEWRTWAEDHGPNIIGIIAVLFLVRYFVTRVVSKVIRRAALRAGRARNEDEALVERRVNTLLSTLAWLFTIFLALVGTAAILDQFDIQISALLAGVGVVGIAVGLGAQTLIKDVINGLFILVEGQYAVGDVVQVAGVSGQVVEITPRRTVLRDENGNVHIIPNSAIGVATNMTQGFSRINLDVTVSIEEDLSRAEAAINAVCAELANERPADFIVPPRVRRVESLAAGGAVFRVSGDVKVFTQWDLASELRRRLKERFDREGIKSPFTRTATADATE